MAVIVEHGLHGDAAAPLAAKIANFYLDKKYGHPFDPEPTLGERWRAGRSGTNGQWDAPNRRLVPPSSAATEARGDRQGDEKEKRRERARDAETPKREPGSTE